jgi:hypothetical protein
MIVLEGHSVSSILVDAVFSSALMIEAGRFSAHIHRLYVLEDGSVYNHCQENGKSRLTSDRYIVGRPSRTPRSKCAICC